MGDVTTIKIEEMQEYNKINKFYLKHRRIERSMRAWVNWERRNSHCGMLRHVMPVKLSILACRQQTIEDLTGAAFLIVSVRQVPGLLGVIGDQ